MLTPDQRAMLTAIIHSDDPAVAPRDRLDALKVQADHPDHAETAGVALALYYLNLSDEELAREAAAIFAPVPTEAVEP